MEENLTRRDFVAGTTAAGVAGVAGCLSDNSDNTFRFTVTFFPPELDPLENDGGGRGREVGYYESLFRVDETAAIQPQLVDDWNVADDEVTWTFTLRDDVTFHNGDPLTAEAAEFALDRAFSNDRSRLQELPIEDVSAEGEHTLTITTADPFASLPAQLARPSAAIISPESMADGEFDQPISTGPFAFESWDPESEIVLSRNEEYYGTVPSIERAVYERIDEPETELRSLQAGEVSLGTDLPNSAIEELDADADTDLYTTEGGTERIIVFNTDEPPLDERVVRQAILTGIDRDALLETALDGVGTTATTAWDPDTISWANEDLDPYTYDPDEARSLLEEAGWEANGDGVRTRDGEELGFELWAYTERPNLPDIAEALQAQLGELGFDISVRVTEWATLDEAKGNGEYEAFVGNWSMFGIPPDPDVLSNFYHPDDNIIDSPYENEDVIDLLEDGRQTFDDDERKAIYDEVQELTMRDAPVGFLARETFIDGASTELDGYDPDPNTFELGLEHFSL